MQMDFARQNTGVLPQPDCRRTERSHLIKVKILASSSSRIMLLTIAKGPCWSIPCWRLPQLLCNNVGRLGVELRLEGKAEVGKGLIPVLLPQCLQL